MTKVVIEIVSWKKLILPTGQRELITAPLDGTILPGVTRDSVLALARKWGEFVVSERPYTVHDIIKLLGDGRVSCLLLEFSLVINLIFS